MQYLPVTSLAILGLTGFFALHGLGRNDGLFAMLEDSAARNVYQVSLTSNNSLNELASFFVVFFYPTVDGSNSGLSFACIVFAGQWTAAHTLIILEGHRLMNSGKLISYVTLLGLTYQAAGAGLIVPLYVLLHLTTTSNTTNTRGSEVIAPAHILYALPVAVCIGFVLPTTLISFPAPNIISPELKLNLILIWQLFPLWTSISLAMCSRLLSVSKSISLSQHSRTVYHLAIIPAAMTHIIAITFTVFTWLFPDLFWPGTTRELSSALFSFPPHPFSDAKVSNIAEGVLWFIQWDYLLSGSAMLIWSSTVSFSASDRQATRTVEVVKIALKVLLVGPMATSALLIRKRDELALRDYESSIGLAGDKSH